jgi:hypothetical protein
MRRRLGASRRSSSPQSTYDGVVGLDFVGREAGNAKPPRASAPASTTLDTVVVTEHETRDVEPR